MGDGSHTETGSAEAPREQRFNGWWWALGALPVGVAVQLLFCEEQMAIPVLCFDLYAFVRIVIGLIRQPESPDWYVFCWLPYAMIPITWVVFIVVETLSHWHPFAR
jgi:hypothetical protein